MALFSVSFKSSAEKELRKIDKVQIPKILREIQNLAEDGIPKNSRKLVGATSTYRIRIGDYRVVYSIDFQASKIEISKIAHRKDVYK